jgi:hypothetical protein
MAERKGEKKQSLKDRAQEFVQGVAEALESLFPQPELVPVPARARASTAGNRRRR